MNKIQGFDPLRKIVRSINFENSWFLVILFYFFIQIFIQSLYVYIMHVFCMYGKNCVKCLQVGSLDLWTANQVDLLSV